MTARIYLPVHLVVLIVAVDEGDPVVTLLDSANALALPMLPCSLERRTFFCLIVLTILFSSPM